MKQQQLIGDERAQMLLAAGLVLLMSLLSMSLYGVFVAGYDLPHTSDAEDVLDAAEEVQSMFEPLAENRTLTRIAAGMDNETAGLDAISSIEDDLQRHGSFRGMQFSLTGVSTSQVGTVLTVAATLTVASDASITLPLSAQFDLSS